MPLFWEVNIKCMEEAKHTNWQDKHREVIDSRVFFFNVAEMHEKLKVDFSDILLVATDEISSRNKLVWLKNETREYTLMNVSFPLFLIHSEKLLKVNKFTLLSVDLVHSCTHDFITLYNLFPGWNNKQVTLGRHYRDDFYKRFGQNKTQKHVFLKTQNLSFTT